jgi:acyl transferase domain-containing protein
VAIHLACQSLRLGESEMASTCGTNLILGPEITLTYSTAGRDSAVLQPMAMFAAKTLGCCC